MLEVGDLIHYDHLSDPLQLCPCEFCMAGSTAVGVVTEVWQMEDGTLFVDAYFDMGAWTFRLDATISLPHRGLTILARGAPLPVPHH